LDFGESQFLSYTATSLTKVDDQFLPRAIERRTRYLKYIQGVLDPLGKILKVGLDVGSVDSTDDATLRELALPFGNDVVEVTAGAQSQMIRNLCSTTEKAYLSSTLTLVNVISLY
jgi:hypothetical protein